MTDIPGNITTGATVSVGGTVTGSLETVGDHDWYRISLAAGQSITVTMTGSGGTPLEDPYLYLRDRTGATLKFDDDGGDGRNAQLHFTATTAGNYYIDAGAWNDTYAGTFTLSVTPYTPPVRTLFDNDQIADQLVNGYWQSVDGAARHFNVTQGGSLTFSVSGLTAPAQTLAREALNLWSDVIGVHFNEVAAGGQISFDDTEDGAYSSSITSGNIITHSDVNISTQWLTDYGTGFDTYSFQTFIHEIGHALGLGHAGDYNGDAIYADDALYLNDAWSTTVMSYFSPSENDYFSAKGFTSGFVVTPMSADIVAMQALYGLSTATRLGDTTYGFHSTAGRWSFDASQTLSGEVGYTIIDSGGVDTLDYSGYSSTQRIDLNSESFSNVGGGIGNVSIARGTVIENVIGGSGADTIVGNGADNVLDGRGGSNTISYEAALAGVTIDTRVTAAQDTGGAGRDTLLSYSQLIGSAFDDVLTGKQGITVHGGAGNDRLIFSGSGNALFGDAGDDTYYIASASDQVVENSADGDDTVVAGFGYTLGSNLENLTLSGSGGISGTGNGLDNAIAGNSGANMLAGLAGDDRLYGNAGSDTLDGGAGVDKLYGGVGDDTYIVSDATDYAYENAAEGYDSVRSSISVALRSNIEALVLTGTANLTGNGNDLANLVEGNSGANRLFGEGGIDELRGNAGNDILDGGAGADLMKGGIGNDTYTIDNANDQAVEDAGEGYDRVNATVDYTIGANIESLALVGSAAVGHGNDIANSIGGNDLANSLYGEGGNDRLFGHGGNDVLDGGSGGDAMRGGAGDDIYYVDNGHDAAVEEIGEGTDTVYASVNVNLRANVENLTFTGGNAVNGTGNAEANAMTGNDAANVLAGLSGDDVLHGNGGADVLRGGDGNDWIDGGGARDVLEGGAGSDTFVFHDGDFAGVGSAADQIIDFSSADHDQINLQGVDANSLAAGDQAFAFIGTADFHGSSGELRFEQISGNTYIQGDTNGDGIADFWVRLDGSHALTSGDFGL